MLIRPDDSNKLIFKYQTVPSSAKTGITKMRVSMKKGGPGQTPCEVFSRGEVEDYSVNIIPAKLVSSFEHTMGEKISMQLNIYPNPATNLLIVNVKGSDGKVSMQVFDLAGKVTWSQFIDVPDQQQIDVQALPPGIYILRVRDGSGNIAIANG
ncbi:MAG: T9SS type A sorting domain-containing protein [Parafilimonas sp.]